MKIAVLALLAISALAAPLVEEREAEAQAPTELPSFSRGPRPTGGFPSFTGLPSGFTGFPEPTGLPSFSRGPRPSGSVSRGPRPSGSFSRAPRPSGRPTGLPSSPAPVPTGTPDDEDNE